MKKIILSLFLFNLLSNCNGNEMKNLETVTYVDIEKFMGKWYVISIIPNWIEKNPYNSIEEYSLDEKGFINVKYTFNDGSFNGKKRTLKQKAFIQNTLTNSEWKIQPFWPLRFPYFIIDLASDYSYTVIGYPNRKLLWIMSRTKEINDQNFKLINQKLLDQGYDLDLIIKIPHE